MLWRTYKSQATKRQDKEIWTRMHSSVPILFLGLLIILILQQTTNPYSNCSGLYTRARVPLPVRNCQPQDLAYSHRLQQPKIRNQGNGLHYIVRYLHRLWCVPTFLNMGYQLPRQATPSFVGCLYIANHTFEEDHSVDTLRGSNPSARFQTLNPINDFRV